MKTYKINTEESLGISHSGSVNAEGVAEIQLCDQDIDTLYEIMEKALAEDPDIDLYDLDLSDTDLKEIDSDLYDEIYDAYYQCAFDAEFAHWAEDGYYRSEVLENVDWNHAREICIDRYGYRPKRKCYDDYDAEYDSHFREWFEKKIIRGGDIAAFEREENLLDMDMGCFEFSSLILLPPLLVDEFLADRHPDLIIRTTRKEIYYHGSGQKFWYDLSVTLEDVRTVKYGYGVYVTPTFASAARRSSVDNFSSKHYVYSVKVPAKTPTNFIASKQPVHSVIVTKAEAKLGLHLPEKAKLDGKEFRKFLVAKFSPKEEKDRKKAKFEGEREAARFLLSIGVEFFEWPYSLKNPTLGQNRIIFDGSATDIDLTYIV